MQKSTKQLHVVILKDKSVDPLSRQTYIQPGGQIETDRETERQTDRQTDRETYSSHKFGVERVEDIKVDVFDVKL